MDYESRVTWAFDKIDDELWFITPSIAIFSDLEFKFSIAIVFIRWGFRLDVKR